VEYQDLPGLWVSVDRVEYVSSTNTPPHRPHQFAYFITIHNDSLRVITVLGRKWVVTNDRGHKMVVEADGVVGQFPRLTPGDQFQYNSYHLLDGNSRAEGAYLCRDEEGVGLIARIPPFQMEIPR
jgi:ApaG protein